MVKEVRTMLFRNERSGRIVSTDNPETIQIMEASDNYTPVVFVAEPAAPVKVEAPKPKKQAPKKTAE